MSLFKDSFFRAVLLAVMFYVFVMALWGYGLDRNHQRDSLENSNASYNLRLGAAYPVSEPARSHTSENLGNSNASHNLRLGEAYPVK